MRVFAFVVLIALSACSSHGMVADDFPDAGGDTNAASDAIVSGDGFASADANVSSDATASSDAMLDASNAMMDASMDADVVLEDMNVDLSDPFCAPAAAGCSHAHCCDGLRCELHRSLPSPTTRIELSVRFDTRQPYLSTSFTYASEYLNADVPYVIATVYDSLGGAHAVWFFFMHGSPTSVEWNWTAFVDGRDVDGFYTEGYPVGSGSLAFTNTGALDYELASLSVGFLGSPWRDILVDFGDAITTDGGGGFNGSVAFASPFAVERVLADGTPFSETRDAPTCVDDALLDAGAPDLSGRDLGTPSVEACGNYLDGCASSACCLGLRCASVRDLPSATTSVEVRVNLDARVATPSSPFSSEMADETSNYSTVFNVFDSLGGVHSLKLYFIKTYTNNWEWHLLANGTELEPPYEFPIEIGSGVLGFTTDGRLDTEYPTATTWTTFAGATPIELYLDFGDAITSDGSTGLSATTQFAAANSVDRITDLNGAGPSSAPPALLCIPSWTR